MKSDFFIKGDVLDKFQLREIFLTFTIYNRLNNKEIFSFF